MIMCALWNIEPRELDRRPQGLKPRVVFYLILGQIPSLSIHLKTWSRPLSQSEPKVKQTQLKVASHCFLKSGENANTCILKCFPWIFQKGKNRETGEGLLRTRISSTYSIKFLVHQNAQKQRVEETDFKIFPGGWTLLYLNNFAPYSTRNFARALLRSWLSLCYR